MHTLCFITAILLLVASIQADTTTFPWSSPISTSSPSTISIAPSSLPLGAQCTGSSQCSGGANCYAVNYMEIERCGNFQAACSNSSQCAFNSCVKGFCSGLVTNEGNSTLTVVVAPKTLSYGSGAASSMLSPYDTEAPASWATSLWLPSSIPAFLNRTATRTTTISVVTLTSTAVVTGAGKTESETAGVSATKTVGPNSVAGRMRLSAAWIMVPLAGIFVGFGML